MSKKFNLLYWYVYLVFFLEMMYKIFVWENFFDLQLISILFFSLPFSFLFYYLSKLGNKLINKIFCIVITFFISLIFIAQFVYYEFYKSMFSISSAILGSKQVFGEFGGAIFDYIIRFWYVIIIMLIPLLFLLFFGLNIFDFERIKKKNFLITFLIFTLLYVSNFISLSFMNSGLYSNKRLYYNVHSPLLTINRLGLLTMEKLDIKRFIFGFKDEFLKITDNENTVYNDKFNVSDIDFDKLISKETNQEIKNMHKYFQKSDASEKNNYTGIFKNKNLIFITAESLDISAIRKDITPTLYMMLNEGIKFNNFYQPLYPISTSDGEYMAVNSLIPKESVWSFYESSKINMRYGIGNVFKNLDYKTYGYHNHSYNYYNRELSHTNIGLEYYGCGNGLEKKINCNLWPKSDLEMINETVKDYIKEDKFMTYYMTVSGHLRYNDYNQMAVKNKETVKDLQYSDSVKSYLSTNVELDKAMESLLDHLKSVDKLNDTLIVIVPDHYPYGLSIKELNEISEKDRNDKFELYHTSLIMYNPLIENTEINDYVSSLDILPTIYNLFGIEYDSRLLMGRDIFSSSEKIVIYSDRSWITNKGKYNSITNEFTSFENNVEKDYVEEINEKVYQKFTISSYILDNDYYNKLVIEQ